MKRIKNILLITVFLFGINDMTYADNINIPKETINYKIKYGFISGGDVLFKTEVKTLKNELVYHTKIEAKTAGLLDQLYKVYDVYESYYDIDTGLPKLFVRDINEGKYHSYDEITYNQKAKKATSLKKDTTYILEKPTYDILSAIQHLRSLDWTNLKVNDKVEMATIFDKEPFPIYAVYKGKETITIGSHNYDCHKFAPVFDPGKILKKKEDLTIWFSDDENKIPINIKLNLLVGSFRLEFDGYKHLPYPLTAQKSKK